VSRIKFQIGRVNPKQAVAVLMLTVTLWAVFPSKDPAKDSKKQQTSAEATQNGGETAEGVLTGSGEAAAASSVVNSPGEAASTSGESPMRAGLPMTQPGRPYEPLNDADIRELAAINPFMTTAVEIAEQAREGRSVAKNEEPPEQIHRRILQGKAAGASVSLVYSSSRGTSATVINREILKPGMTTSDGLEVHEVGDSGVRVRLSSEKSPEQHTSDAKESAEQISSRRD
jgi:hypothetical protein